MQRYAQLIQLRSDCETDYIRAHKHVWPTVLQTVADCGIRNYSIFLRNGLLFAYFEYHGSNFLDDMRKMASCPETQRWWSMMDPMQEPMADALPAEKWSTAQEVFHFDGPVVRE